MQCTMFSSIPGLYPPPVVQPKMSSHLAFQMSPGKQNQPQLSISVLVNLSTTCGSWGDKPVTHTLPYLMTAGSI
jgi:hypothetical protein